MSILYKVTDKSGKTKNDTQWGEGVSHTAIGESQELCTNGFIHAYEHPLIAAFMHPAHTSFKNPILWEAEGEIVIKDGQLKCGVKTLTTLKKIPLPEITLEQRIAIAIHCALTLPQSEGYKVWAEKWLSGEDRSRDAAADAASYAAARAAYAYAASAAAARAASYADAAADASVGNGFNLLGIIEKVVKS